MAHASDIVNTKDHWAVGVEWLVEGSTGNTYKVTMTKYGFECDCIAYRKCKHIKKIEKGFDTDI